MEQDKNTEKKPLSFGFSKRQEIKKLGTSAVGEQTEKVDLDVKDDSKDFVLAVEQNEVKSTNPQSEKKQKEYVIPLIKQNKWRLNATDEAIQSDSKSNLDLIAAKEILQDSAKLNGDWEERGKVDNTRSIPLLMQNKIPEGFETDNQLNVDLRPDEPKDADYDQIPIEQFGLALLRGMGWKEGKGIGKNAKMIAPLEAQLRPKGLGLGADKANIQGKEKTSNSEKQIDSEEKIELKSGCHCVVLSGKNKDLYGTVEGIDEDNSRAMIKLSVSGKVINLMQCAIRVVSKKDFEKHSKYINKLKVDKYKDDEKKRSSMSKGEHYNGRESERDQEKRSEDKTDSKRYKHHSDHHKEDSNYDKYHKKESKKSKRSYDNSPERDYYENKHRKHKHKHQKTHKKKESKHRTLEYREPSSDSEVDQFENEIQRPWLHKDLRVRIVDKNLKGGKYFKEKVIIEDVLSPNCCVCKTADGKVIDNVLQSSLETVIPRTDDAVVYIVGGSHRGLLGEIMKRDKDKCLAIIQLLSDRDVVLRLQYDEICEYVGDTHFVE